MSKMNLSSVAKSMRRTLTKHSPEILTGIGIAGMITTTVLAVKETPKAVRLLEERKDELETEKLPAVEIVKTTWKCYIPAAVTCTLSAACLIGASSVNLKRNAALATAYQLSEKALTTYKEKVVETIGEKKEKIIKDKVAEEHIKENPKSQNEVIITGNGDVLCYDAFSGRYFTSSKSKIDDAVNAINKTMLDDWCVSLNDFYDELNLDHTKLGDSMGWNTDGDLVKVYFSSQLTDEGKPCLVLDFDVAPNYNYYRMN